MYSLTDRSAAIKEVQRLLGLNQTGEYNAETQLSVTEHQSQNQIPVTGVVDYRTFESITDSYRDSIAVSNANSGFLIQPKFPYSFGAYDSNVGHINAIIRDIFTRYTIESKHPRGNFYGTDTIEAIKALREIFMLEPGEEVDEILFNRMLKERDSLKFTSNR